MAKSSASWIIPLVAIVSLFGIFTWQLGIFNISGSSITSTGFAKIKPQLAGTGFGGDGSVNAIFTNGAGARVTILGVQVQDLISNYPCNAQAMSSVVAPGDNFIVRVAGCHQARAGDVANTRFAITYEVSIGGIPSTHTDTGTIRGPMESSGSAPYAGSYASSGASQGAYYGGYSSYYKPGYHSSFDFGEWWLIVIVLCIAFILDAYGRLNSSTDTVNVQLLGIYGFIFILCSSLIFIFGVDHLFNGQDTADVSLRLRFGWVLESLVYFGVGVILSALGEFLVKKEDKLKTIIPPVVRPITSLLIISLIFIYPFRAYTSVMRLSPQMMLSEFGWIVEVLVLASITVAYYLIGKVSAEGTADSEVPAILYSGKAIASAYFIASVGLFITGVNTLIYSSDLNFRGVLTSIFIGLGGVVLLLIHRDKAQTTPPNEKTQTVSVKMA